MGRFLQVPPLTCVPAPTALLEPQPRAATKVNCSEAEWLEQWHLGPSKPPTPPAQFLPQSRGGAGGGNQNRTRFVGSSQQTQRAHACANAHTPLCKPPRCSGGSEEGSSARQRHKLHHSHCRATALCLGCQFQGASRARSLVEKELSEAGHFILAKKTFRLF